MGGDGEARTTPKRQSYRNKVMIKELWPCGPSSGRGTAYILNLRLTVSLPGPYAVFVTGAPAEGVGTLEIINVVPSFRDSRKGKETVSEIRVRLKRRCKGIPPPLRNDHHCQHGSVFALNKP